MTKPTRSYTQVVAAAYDTAIQAVRSLREKRRRWIDLLSDIYGPKAKCSTTLDAIDQWIDKTTKKQTHSPWHPVIQQQLKPKPR